jgi:hypothetical protein
MTYRSPLWSSLREDARDYYLTAMDANIPRTESTERPEERERLLRRQKRLRRCAARVVCRPRFNFDHHATS